jgi:hypothetical protein
LTISINRDRMRETASPTRLFRFSVSARRVPSVMVEWASGTLDEERKWLSPLMNFANG